MIHKIIPGMGELVRRYSISIPLGLILPSPPLQSETLLNIELEELWRRVEKRNADLPIGSFHVRKEELVEWAGLFEAPTPDEFA